MALRCYLEGGDLRSDPNVSEFVKLPILYRQQTLKKWQKEAYP